MKVVLDIPSNFVKHYKLDKFNDSMMRVIQELKYIPFKNKYLVGRYEMETLSMLRLSLMKSETLEADKEKCQQLQRYAKTDMAAVYGKAALEAGKEDNEQ